MSDARATSASVATSFAPAATRSSSGFRFRARAPSTATLGDDILRHAVTHQPKADESDPRLGVCAREIPSMADERASSLPHSPNPLRGRLRTAPLDAVAHAAQSGAWPRHRHPSERPRIGKAVEHKPAESVAHTRWMYVYGVSARWAPLERENEEAVADRTEHRGVMMARHRSRHIDGFTNHGRTPSSSPCRQSQDRRAARASPRSQACA